MKTTKDFAPDDRVLFMPLHAHENKHHPDCEKGTVHSINDRFVFVRFDGQVSKLGYEQTTSQACGPNDLTVINK